jgi:phosphate transport system substrate-binding protein
MSFVRIVSAALVTAAALGLCGAVTAGEKVVMEGSTTVGPIAKAFAEYYMKKNPDVNVTVGESGSGNGAKSLINGTCQIANMSRFMKDKEFKAAMGNGVTPVAHVVAMDGIAMIVHPSNPVKGLSVEQVRNIYLGKITNWKDVGGPDRKIVLVSRDTNSGTFETFHGLVMAKEKTAPGTEHLGSNGAVRSKVQSTAGAIGYVGLGFVDDTVKALVVGGVECNRRSIATGKYPIARPLYMFTNGYPKLGSHVHQLVTLHMTKEGQAMVEGEGFVPLTNY